MERWTTCLRRLRKRRTKQAPATFKDSFVYTDGVKVDVIKITTARLTSSAYTDNDSKAGTPYVVLTMRVTNGTKKRVTVGDYEQIMTYGKTGDEAAEVQDDGIQSIDGTVLPGKSRTGTYGWVVAKKDRKDVQLEFEWASDSVR